MRQILVKYFIPHPTNDHKPHLLREPAVLTLTGLIIVLFLSALIQTIIITQTDLLATIFPGVLVDLANRNREARGLPPLAFNPELAKAAELKASDMAAKGYFAHVSPEGATPWQWFKEAGYNYFYAGENLAVNFSESADVDSAWMASPTHRENILRPEFSEIGIALASGYYQGQSTTFVVQLFGRPAPSFASPEEARPPLEVQPPKETEPRVALENQGQPLEETEVAGEETTGERPVEVVFQTPTFAVNVPSQGQPLESQQRVALGALGTEGQPLGTASYASWFEEILLNPRRSLGWIYFAIGSLIILVVVLMTMIEISRHHTIHIIYGLLVLILMAVLFYLYREAIFTQVLII